jgi:hypothetical protein
MPSARLYKAVYFPGSSRAVTLSFCPRKDGRLAGRMHGLSSARIRSLIGIASHTELVAAAAEERRSLSGLVKDRLRTGVDRRKAPHGDWRRPLGQARLGRWIKELDLVIKRNANPELREIRRHLKELMT